MNSKNLLKAYAWISGILVAFLATYISGALALLVPTPDALLCKAISSFCPPAQQIEFSATDPDRLRGRKGVAQAVGEDQIGMLHNSVAVSHSCKPNSVEYGIAPKTTGEHILDILYASNESRPVAILVNNVVVAENALATVTGGWGNEYRKWSDSLPNEKLRVSLRSGENRILIRRNSCFPHLSKIRLIEVREN